MKKVSIIIVHYNNPTDCLDCIGHLEAQSFTDLQVFIVDNASEDAPFQELYEVLKDKKGFDLFGEHQFKKTEVHAFERINLIHGEENHGYGQAVNIVLQQIMNDDSYILILNPDVNLDSSCLAALVECVREEPEAIYGCKMMDAKQREELRYMAGFRVRKSSGTIKFIKTEEELSRLDAISGGCLFADAEIFRRMGLFPTDYFLYWEDADWCRKARGLQIPLKLCRRAIAYDKGSTTIGNGYLAEYFYTYNALKFLEKESTDHVNAALRFNILRSLKRLWQFRFSNFRAILTACYHYKTNRAADPYS